MFTSRFITFALPSFLVGANAKTCATCPKTLNVNGTDVRLSYDYEYSGTSGLVCIYKDNGKESICAYRYNGDLDSGSASSCPKESKKIGDGC
ncbi:uncharacterized protein EDB91DRAFT_1141866 [Suillus paluster]|uniref:uncharacterized protein n=1 Tax=Suillus paluster TaxID=48578 RepID=UPI001B85D68A|nr:uncharacterized protein EDB91DRAFT_1141866 [Suillus paluster]KAG1736631.1 hypothetical protein EDB91DRAFT_1141866 [Suillus paluster]